MKVCNNAEKMFLEKSREGREIQCGGPQHCSGQARECDCWWVGVGFQLGRVYRSQAKAYLSNTQAVTHRPASALSSSANSTYVDLILLWSSAATIAPAQPQGVGSQY